MGTPSAGRWKKPFVHEGEPVDSRGVFEKALDVAVPVAAGYLGAIGGRKIIKSHQKDMAKYRDPNLDSDLSKRFQAAQRTGGLMWGGLAGAVAGNETNKAYNPSKRKTKR